MPLQLHAAVTEMEQEKFELQKKHTQNIQELLEDTNIRLAKMESDYNARSHATVSTETGMCESGCVCVCVSFTALIQQQRLILLILLAVFFSGFLLICVLCAQTVC